MKIRVQVQHLRQVRGASFLCSHKEQIGSVWSGNRVHLFPKQAALLILWLLAARWQDRKCQAVCPCGHVDVTGQGAAAIAEAPLERYQIHMRIGSLLNKILT